MSMQCIKKLTLTGYMVKYVDLREPKPRSIYEEVYTTDKDWTDAMALLNLNAADAIKARYERGGYHVISVERISPKRCVTLDLQQLWETANQNLITEKVQNGEVCGIYEKD